jgi:hypothetical protein
MGIFIKFECDKCGEYECDHSYEERKGTPNITPVVSYTSPEGIKQGDIISKGIKNSRQIDEAYVNSITEKGEIMVTYLDNRMDGQVTKWEGKPIKISNVYGKTT